MQDTQGFPRVERDLLQVEQYSQQLKARAARIYPAGDALAATRLLAQEGLNTRKCGPVQLLNSVSGARLCKEASIWLKKACAEKGEIMHFVVHVCKTATCARPCRSPDNAQCIAQCLISGSVSVARLLVSKRDSSDRILQ